MSNEHDNIARVFQNRFELDEATAKYVLDQAEALARSLRQPDRKPNDFALAKYLNDRAIALFEMVADHNNTPDVTDINKSYILIVDELKKLYARNPELEKIGETICWRNFDRLEYIQNDLWEYSQYTNSEYGLSHNAQVNRLCISNGKETPDLTPEIKKIINDAEKRGKAFYADLEGNEPAARNWFIPRYVFTYTTDGSLLVNGIKGVLKVKKAQAGSASAKLIEQATAKPNELFKPNLGHNYSRSISVTLSGIGFSGTLRSLFFPQVSEDKGLVFRPVITRDEANAEHIDTSELDSQLKKLGADIQQKELSLDDIVF